MAFVPQSLSDADLVAAVHSLVARSNATEADLVLHMGEVDARRLYADQGSSSMYAWCTGALGMSEGSAYRRIAAARAARAFPALLERLASGTLHLAGIALMAPHLTESNHRELIDACSGKSKRAIESLLADRAPRPDAPTLVRRIPTTESRRASAPAEPSQAATPCATPSTAPPVAEGVGQAPATHASAGPTSAPPPSCDAPRDTLTPLGGARYRVQFTADQTWVDRLREAQALLSHRLPNGDVAVVLDEALSLLCEKLRKERFAERGGRTGQARREGEASAPTSEASQGAVSPGQVSRGTFPGEGAAPTSARPTHPPRALGSRRIPNLVKRAVAARDGGRCTFVSADGRRCEETRFLEFHHESPWARGGAHEPDNITLWCRAHNALAARRDFGAEFVDACVRRTAGGG
jgi:hypothetical protein